MIPTTTTLALQESVGDLPLRPDTMSTAAAKSIIAGISNSNNIFRLTSLVYKECDCFYSRVCYLGNYRAYAQGRCCRRNSSKHLPQYWAVDIRNGHRYVHHTNVGSGGSGSATWCVS